MSLTDNNETKVADQIIDINISGVKKSKFRINGDDNAILELNLSDMGIGERLEIGYNRLQECLKEISQLPEDADMASQLSKVDTEMRKELDYIFDSNVSEVCGKGGTMYDVKDGEFRFESILNALTKLYADNLNEEYKKMKKRIQQHTDKYVGTSKKSRKRG